jgi:spermidine synthase
MQRLGIAALVALGGLVALSWEMLWQVHASLAIGVSAFGTAVTLAATMLGMTLGALLAGRWLRRRDPARPLRLYGWLELGIGALGALLPLSFAALEALDTRLWSLAPGLAPLGQILGIAALLTPPAFAMGASVPVFAEVARVHRVSLAVLYGANTAGAAVGVVLVSFLAIPALGLERTGWLLAAANAAVFLLSRAFAAPGDAETGTDTALVAAATPSFRLAAVLVFCTGFATFAL